MKLVIIYTSLDLTPTTARSCRRRRRRPQPLTQMIFILLGRITQFLLCPPHFTLLRPDTNYLLYPRSLGSQDPVRPERRHGHGKPPGWPDGRRRQRIRVRGAFHWVRRFLVLERLRSPGAILFGTGTVDGLWGSRRACYFRSGSKVRPIINQLFQDFSSH